MSTWMTLRSPVGSASRSSACESIVAEPSTQGEDALAKARKRKAEKAASRRDAERAEDLLAERRWRIARRKRRLRRRDTLLCVSARTSSRLCAFARATMETVYP